MSSPFEKFPRVWRAQEILDYAFGHATKQSASLPTVITNLEKVKRKEVKRVENASGMLVEKIRKIIESVPNLEQIPTFFQKLSHLLVNNDEFRLNLGRLNGVIPVIERLEKDFTHRIWKADDSKACGDLRMEFFGRAGSLIRKQDSTLEFLESCRMKLQQIPSINLKMPSVVVAGYPNVGKSSLVGKMTKAKPTVADYPFTTKQIFFGVYEDQTGSRHFQVIDTPGILDRPMTARNEIEQQAILALNTIATVILFMIDPTPAAGFEVASQIKLYYEVKDQFLKGSNAPLKVIINKIDFATEAEINNVIQQLQLPKDEIFFTNAKDGVNADKIINWLLTYFKSSGYRV